jgi:hypothetical protein
MAEHGDHTVEKLWETAAAREAQEKDPRFEEAIAAAIRTVVLATVSKTGTGGRMPFERRFFRPLGALCILACDPMIEAGVMAAIPLAQEGDYFRLGLGVISLAAAVLLLAAGILLCFMRITGRAMAFLATGISVPVCVFSAAIGLMGGHALLYGVGYPIVIVLLLKSATPSNGLPAPAEKASVPANPHMDDFSLRVVPISQ